jgi:hypothetical protein
MQLDVGMWIAIAGVIIMPIIIHRLAKQLKKVQDMKESGPKAGGAEKAEDA